MIKTPINFPSERLVEISSRPEDFRLLERIPLVRSSQVWPLELASSVGDELPMVLLDIETTGLSVNEESIIELGMAKVMYSPSVQRLTSIVDVISFYEDPGKPIPKEITELTGIFNETVKDKCIDDSQIMSWLSDNPLVVAHNAQFDRPFFEKRFSMLTHLPWACSAYGINWKALGFESSKLEYLLLRLGWFYKGHCAAMDCLAMAWLFKLLPESFANLLVEADQIKVVVRAFGAPFEVKNNLKDRGYRWHNGVQGDNKHWWKEINKDDLLKEQGYLDDLYHKGSKRAHYDYRDARSRFKRLI